MKTTAEETERNRTATEEAEIRALLDDWADAHRVKNADRVRSSAPKI